MKGGVANKVSQEDTIESIPCITPYNHQDLPRHTATNGFTASTPFNSNKVNPHDQLGNNNAKQNQRRLSRLSFDLKPSAPPLSPTFIQEITKPTSITSRWSKGDLISPRITSGPFNIPQNAWYTFWGPSKIFPSSDSPRTSIQSDVLSTDEDIEVQRQCNCQSAINPETAGVSKGGNCLILLRKDFHHKKK